MNTARALIVAAFPTEDVNSRVCEKDMQDLFNALATVVDNNPRPIQPALPLWNVIEEKLDGDACREERSFLMQIFYDMSEYRAPKEAVKFAIDLLRHGQRKRVIELVEEFKKDKIKAKKNWNEKNEPRIDELRERINKKLRRARRG